MFQECPRIPVGVTVSIIHGILQGLHAAHEAKTEDGRPLEIVHRDVSPQNILVGVDGVARLLDFGVAKATSRIQTTRDGQLKGKTAYMSPEQLRGDRVGRQTDVFAAGIVFWELLTNERLFRGDSEGETMARVVEMPIPSPREHNPEVTAALDAVVMRALERDRKVRYATALEMAVALEGAFSPMPTTREVGEFVRSIAAEDIETRSRRVQEIESDSSSVPVEVTDVSSITVESSAKVVEKRRVQRFVLPGLAVIAVASMFGAWFGLYRKTEQTATTTTGTATASATVVVTATSASASVAPVAPPASTVVRSVPERVVVPPRGTSRPRPTRSCNPPYTIDRDGVHIPKPECD